MSDEDIEARLNRAFQVGISAGWQEAAGRLIQEAIKVFQLGKDKEAYLLRDLSTEFMATAEKKHPGVPK